MTTTSQNLVCFDSWSDVVAAATRGDRLWYAAPLDARAREVRVKRVYKSGKLRIDPVSNDADAFTADAGHLSRFRRPSTPKPAPAPGPVPDSIEFDADEISAASAWHGGQGSMLYAIASTGTLSRGTNRPCAIDGEPMNDHEWLADLAGRLADEAEMAAASAIESIVSVTDAHDLGSIADKCRAAIVLLMPSSAT